MDRVLVATAGGIVLLALSWRFASRRALLPCPAWMAWLLESRMAHPLMHPGRTLAPLQLGPGMSVLDAGCGAGRLTIPIAEAVGWEGGVVAADVQPRMLDKVREKARSHALSNIRATCVRLGEGALPRAQFDRAVLVTVLGEIPDRLAALREIHGALKPGGLLAVTEVFPDPHYQSRGKVIDLLEKSGFTIVESDGPWFAHTTIGRAAMKDDPAPMIGKP